jgi:hypothetical protein
MSDPRIPLKQPLLAGILAFLVPGAGHAYQGRYFKAVVYFVCIIGLFLAGMRMSDWKAVYLNKSSAEHGTSGRHTMLRFAAQFGVGLPCVWALVQRERYYGETNTANRGLDRPESFEFVGEVVYQDDASVHLLFGRVDLEPVVDDFGSERIRGRFVGTDETGAETELTLGNDVELDEPIGADPQRGLTSQVLAGGEVGSRPIGVLAGDVPRPLWNWFEAPLEVVEERALHRKLGKMHELAMVFTWVAGLLNLLAIWDAVDGPAYGYGDETESNESPDSAESQEKSQTAEELARSESAELSPEPAGT